MIFNGETITEEEVETKVSEKKDDGKVLVLHNDDYNTFDHVESCLINICKHTPDMAKKCTWEVHNNGRSEVQKGGKDKLTKMKWALQIKGLIASVEDQ